MGEEKPCCANWSETAQHCPIHTKPAWREDAEPCDVCGHPTKEHQCKIICDNCGHRRDCSDP